MGLLRAISTAVSSTMADQWKDIYYCDDMPSNVLVMRGKKRTSSRSSNRKGNEDVITNGSMITVMDGQCLIIVNNGKVDLVCAQPGQFEYQESSEPGIFGADSFKEAVSSTLRTIRTRFTFGGDTSTIQRAYYFNLREITGNKFGTPAPVPFRVVDRNIGLDIDISVRCNGEYTYQIVDPLLFYSAVSSAIAGQFTAEQLAGTIKSEFLSALQPAFARISEMGIRYSALPGHTTELADAMNQALVQRWEKEKGIKIGKVSINSITAPKEDEELIKQAQRTGMFQNPGMAAATLTAAQADAMKLAAGNSNGAAMGFINMNMAQQQGGMNAGNLYQMHMQNQQNQTAQNVASPTQNVNNWSCSCGTQNTGKFCKECGKPKPVAQEEWTCTCGAQNTGKFCKECGKPKPTAQGNNWTCACGTQNTGRFCAECGKPKPAAAKIYRCDKCGWTPENPSRPPRFCPECGDVFDSNDLVS
ncbi:MAG: SPFH domain-containing protein [Oscillospiraceae bacterium]|nr:SPFH domain-containing protein [Oscillospiraceae bacterium]